MSDRLAYCEVVHILKQKEAVMIEKKGGSGNKEVGNYSKKAKAGKKKSKKYRRDEKAKMSLEG